MGYVPYKLQNESGWSSKEPTIIIKEGEPDWEEALTKWKLGQNPTDSAEWKKGVYLITRKK